MNRVLAILILLAGPSGASPRTPEIALVEAVACYEDVDYECAEARLAEALAGELPPATMARARLYEALLAIAWRDTPRARRAVIAIMAIDPRFEPGPLPAQLARIFNEERPKPEPPPHAMARFDFGQILLFGQDGEWWTDTYGFALGAGLLLRERVSIGVGFRASDHESIASANDGTALEDLSMWAVDVNGLWWTRWGPLRFRTGAGIGLGRMSIDSPLRAQEDWLVHVSTPLELSWPIWIGLGLAMRIEPTLILRTEDDATRNSYLLPAMVGLRYGK